VSDLQESALRLGDDLTELRHALHREPEIGLRVPRTQRKVLDALGGAGLEIVTGDRLTSVVGVLRGGHQGPTVLLRGDMDALPVTEQMDLPYKSRVDGAMHACGHDLHTSMLVGAAHLLAERRSELAGDVVFMFQPGEEGWDGAGLMLDEGVLAASGEEPIAAYAVHVMSAGWPQGTFATRSGPLMAASDGLTVTVRGTGGHGSAPHLARDPIPAACEMVLALQTFLTRTVDPFETVVITVGSLHAGTRRNIIPESATFDATIRTFSPHVRDRISQESVRLCEGIAAAHGLEVDAVYSTEYPVTVNDAVETDFAVNTAVDLFGGDRLVRMANPITGSEDFSRVIDVVPGAMVFLGAPPVGVDWLTTPYNHSPYASFDDDVLSDGAALYSALALRRLAKAAADGPTTSGEDGR
jgi:amidohydrolase